jgi:hypothetical protein
MKNPSLPQRPTVLLLLQDRKNHSRHKPQDMGYSSSQPARSYAELQYCVCTCITILGNIVPKNGTGLRHKSVQKKHTWTLAYFDTLVLKKFGTLVLKKCHKKCVVKVF